MPLTVFFISCAYFTLLSRLVNEAEHSLGFTVRLKANERITDTIIIITDYYLLAFSHVQMLPHP